MTETGPTTVRPAQTTWFPATFFTSPDDYISFRSFLSTTIKASPFDVETLKDLEDITEHFREIAYEDSLDIGNSEIILNKTIKTIDTYSNLSLAVNAYIEIKIAKLISMIESQTERTKKKIKSYKEKDDYGYFVKNKIFKVYPRRRAKYFYMKKIASINNVEGYCFLGITRLRQLSSFVGSDSLDPIGDIFNKYGYKFSIDRTEDDEDFVFRFSVIGNSEKLQKMGLAPSLQSIENYTKKNGALETSDTIKFKTKVNAGQTIDELLENTHTGKEKTEDSAPIYNQFEETYLKLIDIIDDIFEKDYVPDFDPYEYKIMMHVLQSMNSDLYRLWVESWEGFEYGDPL
jgi:hypothetical protein